MAPPKEKTHELVTTAQVERTYTVLADTEEQARDRLRTHFKDAGMLREGIVTEQNDKQLDSSAQRIKAINGKAVKEVVVPKPETRQTQIESGGEAGAGT